MQQTYTVVIERDTESGWLIGDVVELPGCHTEAPDLLSLEANIREAIQVYLQTVDLAQEEPLNEFVGTMQVKIPTDLRVPA
jgi:predicted RNase H-like HicB family nuclease